MTRLIVGPFNRVEGDLEVRLEVDGGVVRDARVVSPLYRGFERILSGKPPFDALVYAPRICGICSVSQSVAAAKALASAMGVSVPANGIRATNLIHATENVADHLTHFYLFFMPDFSRDIYRGERWHSDAVERFTALKGTAAQDMLPARAQFMHVLGLLAGKWPHTLAVQPGGSTRAITASEIARLTASLAAFRRFLERFLYGDRLETIAGLETAADLDAWASEKGSNQSDFRRFLHYSKELDLAALGGSTGRYMSYGAYETEDGHLLPRGLVEGGRDADLALDRIAEDVSHAWYAETDTSGNPLQAQTKPDVNRADAYSWCKAPRLDGEVVEVGALARQVVAGHPLIRELVKTLGGNVFTRVVARVLEIAQVAIEMERWARELQPQEPFIAHGHLPESAEGVGLTEAARGSLGHWLQIEQGRIANYQIIAPTTWNFSPRDSNGVPGPLEQALVGAPVRDGESEPVSVQHIVRSFDPCLVCTVH